MSSGGVKLEFVSRCMAPAYVRGTPELIAGLRGIIEGLLERMRLGDDEGVMHAQLRLIGFYLDANEYKLNEEAREMALDNKRQVETVLEAMKRGETPKQLMVYFDPHMLADFSEELRGFLESARLRASAGFREGEDEVRI